MEKSITNSYTVREVCRLTKGKYPKISEADYSKIINLMGEMIKRNFLHGNYTKFPFFMGGIELMQEDTVVFMKNGKIRTNKSVNWYETKKLWANDEECRKSKILVYSEANIRPVVVYRTGNAKFKNKSYYGFRVSRNVLKEAHKVIEDGECLIFKKEKYGRRNTIC